MHLSNESRESLLKYAQRLTDQLAKGSRASLRQQSIDILQQLGARADVLHSHLLMVRRSNSTEPAVSLFAEWSRGDLPEIGSMLQNVPLPFLGTDAVDALRSGTIVFTSLDENTNACSKLMSGMLRELNVSGYEMIPIILRNRLTAIIGLAHDNGPDHLGDERRMLIQLIGKMFVQGLMHARRERRRQREHRQWKRIANGACDYALRVNSDLEIVGCIAFRQQRIPQLNGLLLQEFVSAASRESLMELIHAAVSAGIPRSAEFLAIDANGRPCSYAARIEPSAGSTTGDLMLYLTNNDLERAHAEELSSLRDQLDRATRLSLLGNIATEFAHQLTQPLQAVSNSLFTLKSRIRSGDSPPAKLMDCAGNIEASVNHASDIIKSLRDFVRDRRMKPSQVCLRKMIEHAVSMIQLPAERSGVKVSVQDPHQMIDAANATLVYVDRVQTTHVIINLLVNAIEACTEASVPEPQITIFARPASRADRIVVEVSDNGPGLPSDRLESVFERFFTTKSEGFGIGLAICRDVIERQGGNIHARLNADGGCCFYFTLLRGSCSEAADSIDETEPEL
jgi:signal transduction histidine kinase